MCYNQAKVSRKGQHMNRNREQSHNWFNRIDTIITAWMARHGVALLRISVGIVFLWFGVLKFFPNLSPAEDLAARTISALTFGVVQPNVSVPVLALWETVIGLGLISGLFMRASRFEITAAGAALFSSTAHPHLDKCYHLLDDSLLARYV